MRQKVVSEPTDDSSASIGLKWYRTYLNLKQVIAAYTPVMHLMISIICVAATLILDKSEAGIS